MSTQYAFPSELLYEATALADGDWVVVQHTGERRLAKISGINFGNISGLSKDDGNFIVGNGTQWVVESGATARASLSAAALTGSLDENWRCANLRTSTGYLYEQVQDGSIVGAIRLEDETYSAMSFRNAGGFRFFNDISGTTPGSVVVGSLQTRTITPETAGTYHIGSVALPFDDGFFTGELYVRAVTSRTIMPESDSAYNIGSNLVRFAGGYFDNLYTGPLQSATILPSADETHNLGSAAMAWENIYYQTATDVSDKTLKTDIADGDLGLDFIDALHPVKFRWRVGGSVDAGEKDGDGRPILTPRPGVRFHYGLLADEVKSAMGEKDFGGYVEDAESSRKGLRYSQIVSVLIKAVQELHGQVKDDRQARLAMEQRLAVLEKALARIGGNQA